MKRKPPFVSLEGLRCKDYARTSNDEKKDRENNSIDAQHENNKDYILRHGGIYVGSISDEGRTGTNINRPGFKQLLAEADAKLYDVAVGTFMSRFARGPAFTIAEWELSKRGIPIVLTEEKFADDTSGYTLQGVKQLMDGLYPKIIGEHTTSKMRQMFKNGYWLGGYSPLGLEPIPATSDPEGPKILVPTDAMVIVVEAMTLFANDTALYEVRDFLSISTGEEWTNHRTRNLLTNRYYIGEYKWGDLTRQHEPLIETELFEAVQDRVNGAKRDARRTPRSDADKPYAYPLRGVLYCLCGRVLTTGWTKSRHGYIVRYYECPEANCGSGKRLRFNTQHLHGSLVAELSRMATHPWRAEEQIRWAAQRMPPMESYEARITMTARRLSACETAINKYTEAVPQATGRALAPLLRKIDQEEEKRMLIEAELSELKRARLEARWRPTQRELADTLEIFGQVWQVSKPEEQARVLSTLVDRGVMRSPKQCEIFLRVGEWAYSDLPKRLGGSGIGLEKSEERRRGQDSNPHTVSPVRPLSRRLRYHSAHPSAWWRSGCLERH